MLTGECVVVSVENRLTVSLAGFPSYYSEGTAEEADKQYAALVES